MAPKRTNTSKGAQGTPQSGKQQKIKSFLSPKTAKTDASSTKIDEPLPKTPERSEQEPPRTPSSRGAAPSELDKAVLKAFDLNLKFGPTVGLSRLERWERAQKLGQTPPKEVLDILTSKVDPASGEARSCFSKYSLGDTV